MVKELYTAFDELNMHTEETVGQFEACERRLEINQNWQDDTGSKIVFWIRTFGNDGGANLF